MLNIKFIASTSAALFRINRSNQVAIDSGQLMTQTAAAAAAGVLSRFRRAAAAVESINSQSGVSIAQQFITNKKWWPASRKEFLAGGNAKKEAWGKVHHR